MFPENIGTHLAFDETSLSNGELYTILLNKQAKGKKKSIVAIMKGTKASEIIPLLKKIPKDKRDKVEEVSLDMAPNMNLMIKTCFPKANRVIDRFHVQKLAIEATQKIRIEHRWKAIEQEAKSIKTAKAQKERYAPLEHSNGDTTKQLLARSRYILFKPSSKWTTRQAERAKIVFALYPDIKKAYDLSMELRGIYEQKITPEVARTKMAQWYDKAENSGFKSFESIQWSFQQYDTQIINFFINRSTNAAAESFNAKIKDFRKDYRGVADLEFFLYRLTTIFA